MSWQHDHTECVKHVPAPRKTYDVTPARRTIHEFKSAKYIEAIQGTELQAERRCIELRRQHGGNADFFYRTVTA